ncbi:MAG: SdpI family protein [Saprospiraceae bacterium]|nr:SdpI family protein [Saprospiraceae bacterium]MCZ2339942.1 SdpI family protein [Chitinophagales bacterium]
MIDLAHNSLQILGLLVGGIFALAGAIQYNFPPKKINQIYGYRTRSSMKNIQNWHFAQLESAKYMMMGGGIYTAVCFLLSILPLNEGIRVSIAILLMIMIAILVYIITEKAIKNQEKD